MGRNHVELESAAAAAGFVPDVAFETTDDAVTMTLVANGLGPAFVSRPIIGTAPAGVRQVDVAGGHDLHRMISIVHRDPVHTEVVTAVIEELRARVGAAGKMPG